MAAPPNLPYPPHHAGPQIAIKSEPPGTTEPLASRMNVPSSPGALGPYGSTMGLAPPRSPLATSMTSGIPSAPVPASAGPPHPAPIAPTRISDPPMVTEPSGRSGGLIIGIIVLVIAIGGGAAYVFLR